MGMSYIADNEENYFRQQIFLNPLHGNWLNHPEPAGS